MTVEIAFSTDPDATLPAWQDVSAFAMGFSTRRGRTSELEQVQSSTLDLRLRNDDRRFDPTYTKSPYYPYVLPMRKVRVSATWSGTTYYLFTGYVERWPLSWEGPRFGTVELAAVDGLAALAQAAISGTFVQELTGSRVGDVLNAAAWPASTPVASSAYWTLGTSTLGTSTVLSYGAVNTLLDPGQSVVQAVTVPDDGSVSALQQVQEITAAERGLFFLDGQGRAVFHDRHHRFSETSQVTFTDDQTVLDATHLPYQQLEPEYDAARVINEVKVTRTGGATQTSTDAVSRQRYQRRTLALSPPLTTDAEAMDQAAFELMLHKDPALRFTALTLKPTSNDNTWPYALGLELSDRITVQHSSGASASITAETLTQPCFVEAIAQQVSADLTSWQTTFQLSPATLYDQFFTLGVSQLDSPTNATLAY